MEIIAAIAANTAFDEEHAFSFFEMDAAFDDELALAAVNANQCRLLERALAYVHQWVEIYSGLPEAFVQEICRIRSTGQALIKECITSRGSYMWLNVAVLREERRDEFSLVLERLSEALRGFVKVNDEASQTRASILRCVREAKFLLEGFELMRSVKLVDEAAKDRRDLMALLERVIAVNCLNNTAEVACFLLGVLEADNFNAWKEASQVNPADFVYKEWLGGGAYGNIFEATWKGLVSKIAVKQNYCREDNDIELAALFTARHANVVRVFGCSPELPSLLLLERMGGNLDSFIDSFGGGGVSLRLPLSISIDILLQVARGMVYLHEKKIVHRDLKPNNILIDIKWPSTLTPQEDQYNLTLKIADFGTSRIDFDHTTHATARIGTSVYRAPEIIRGDNDRVSYGLKVDVYSFGMVCYKVLTGCHPDLGRKEILEGLRPEIRASSHCPEALISLMMQCWDEDPHKRPSFSEVYDILVSIKYRGLITTPSKHSRLMETASININQCRLLEGVIKAIDRWLEMWRKPVKMWNLCEYSCLSEPFVQEMHSIRRTGQALIKECITSPSSYMWLRMAVQREERTEEFSLVLERFSQALHNFVKVKDEDRRQTHSSFLRCIHKAEVLLEGLDLLCFVKVNDKCMLEAKVLLDELDSLRSGKLVDEASKDRRDLIALLYKVIGGAFLHVEDNTAEVACFLLGVLEADNFNAWKKAIQVNPRDFADKSWLGEGSYGNVFEATWKGLVSKIAVKENKFRAYHDVELAALFTARHANVVRVFGCSTELLMLERMEGNLDSFIERFAKGGTSSRLPLSISMDILLQIARGMAYLHEKKIVHRNLKPTNILLDKWPSTLSPQDHYNLTLKIVDFSTSSDFIGTSLYRAPEIMRGDNDKVSYGLEVDTYSFGMVCYKVLTGCEPNLGQEEILKGLRPEIRALSYCPEALISLMMQCWHADPHKRPSFSEVYDILVSIKYIGLITTTSKDITLLGVVASVLLLIILLTTIVVGCHLQRISISQLQSQSIIFSLLSIFYSILSISFSLLSISLRLISFSQQLIFFSLQLGFNLLKSLVIWIGFPIIVSILILLYSTLLSMKKLSHMKEM